MTTPKSKMAPRPLDSGAPPVPKTALSPRGRGSVPASAADDADSLLALFAENMRRIRKARDLSQEALADLCDLDRTYISGIERKRRNLSIRNIQRIAQALQVEAHVLLDPAVAQDPRFKF